MLPQVTLDGIQLHPLNDDGTGFGIDKGSFTGWDGTPSPKTAYTDKTNAAGSFYAPAYNDKRVIAIGGQVYAPDRRSLLVMKRQLKAICRDPLGLYEMRVVDDLGTLTAWVQRSAEVLFSPISDIKEKYSIQVTAPDPRLLDPEVQSPTTPMAQSSGLGLEYRGPLGTGGLRWRGSDGLHGLQWRGSSGGNGISGIIQLDNSDGTAEADVILTIRGPALNPKVSTATDTIAYEGSLGVDDILVINTGAGSVMLNGGNRRNLLTSSDFFTIPAESTLDVRFSAEIQNATASLTASYQVSYEG